MATPHDLSSKEEIYLFPIAVEQLQSVSNMDKDMATVDNFYETFELSKFIDLPHEIYNLINIELGLLYQREHCNVFTFGSNERGQLGFEECFEVVNEDATQISEIHAKAVSGGDDHTLLIDLDDNVFVFGDYDCADSFITQIPKIKAMAVSAGRDYSILIDLENNVWTFGNNDHGQLGLGDTDNRSVPTQILGIKAMAVSAGGCHSILIDLDGNVFTFGLNDCGQLGLGDTDNRSVPTQILGIKAKAVSAGRGFGEGHSILIDLDGNVFTFGCNDRGQLGLGDTDNRSVPTQSVSLLQIPIKAKAVSAGSSHSILIDLDDKVFTFGSNEYGQLGLYVPDWRKVYKNSRFIPTQIPEIKAKAVSAGTSHSILIDLDNDVYTFGNNESGELGVGHTENSYEPLLIDGIKATAVSAGGNHCIIIGQKYNPVTSTTGVAEADYLERHRIQQLFQELTADLLHAQPRNPLQFLMEKLEKRLRK
jgi:alpha-tubulin suppressor-like RCC1 family protein